MSKKNIIIALISILIVLVTIAIIIIGIKNQVKPEDSLIKYFTLLNER